MDWDDLKYFLALTRSQTLSEAADKLSVNQTTVSRRLKKFQRDVGLRLLRHNNNGIDTTRAGAEVSDAAKQIESIISALERKLSGLDQHITGVLRISADEYMATFENQLFKSFMQRHPKLALEINNRQNDEKLLQGNVDIALCWTNQPAENLVGRKLCRAEFALYRAHQSERAAENFATPSGLQKPLSQQSWLVWDQSCNAKLTEDWIHQQLPNTAINCRINSAAAMYHAVKSGLGIAFLPCAYADPDPQLQRLRNVEKDFGMDIWALTHPDLRGAGKISAFIQHAERYFAEHQHRYAGCLEKRQQRDSRAHTALEIRGVNTTH